MVEPLLPAPSAHPRGGRPEKHPRREIVDAILYVVRTGCAWRAFETAWRYHVLSLTTFEETQLSESQGADDQAEWLDDEHVIYGFQGQLSVVPANGTGAARVLMFRAVSPAVIR